MTSQGSSWPDYKFIAESLCYKLKALNLKDVFIHPNENTLLSCIMGIVGPSVFGAKTQVAQPVVFFFFNVSFASLPTHHCNAILNHCSTPLKQRITNLTLHICWYTDVQITSDYRCTTHCRIRSSLALRYDHQCFKISF